MNKTRKSISVIIAILLVCSIIFAVLSIFLRAVVLNKNTYTTILEKNDTYAQVTEAIYYKIDALLSAKNINYDIKESIITEDDIRNEFDNVISGFIQYLKTDKNDIKPVDTELYKQRVSDVLHSAVNGIVKPNTNDLSFNGNVQAENLVSMGNKIRVDNMIISKEKSNVGQTSIEVQKLMTKDEAEAKVREILKEKGITEEQAIEMARKKGITEEQALKILAGYGITIDDKSEGNESKSESSDNSNVSSKQGSDNTTESSRKEQPANSQKENIINVPPTDKSIKSPLDSIVNKLLDEAGSSIEKEVEKMDMNKMLQSSKLQKLVKIEYIIYKMFWIFMIMPIFRIAILIKIHGKDINSSLKYIRNAFLSAGLILFAIFFGAYALKSYEKFNIDIVYFKDIISYIIKHFLIVLSTYSIVIFVLGLFLFIPTIKKVSKQN